MKPKKLFLYIALTTLLALVGASGVTAHEEGVKAEKVGQTQFAISCGDAAQKEFNYAVAVLHSFWYKEAEKTFTAFAEKYPDCALGYWGVAMSLYYPLWEPPKPEALKKGWAAIEKAKALSPKTERERDYIAALEVFYKDADKVDHRTRALAYQKAMEQVYRRYPQDREAAVFYSLTLLGTALPTDKTYANQLKAAKILEKVFAEQPEHPGAAHYLIHSYDYPPLASLGLLAARRYARIAPSVPHALHMPSHIFTRLGLWQEAIASDRNSAAAAQKVGSVFEQLHAMDYMMYAYLQGAQDREARRVLEERNSLAQRPPENLAAAYALVATPARYTLERGRWTEASTLEPVASNYPSTEAVTYFARALGAARSGDITGARKNIEKLQSLRNTLIEAKQRYWADQVEIQRQEALAWLAKAEGENDEALKLMRAAADLEDSTEKHPVTPGAIVPARELLGELLLELKQPRQALTEFETSLKVSPNRFHGLYGAARAAELSGNSEKASAYYTQLVKLCERADSPRPELQKAKRFLATK